MTESNVVHAFGAAPPSELEKEMLETVERFLVDIRAGRLVAVAIAGVTTDAAITTGWTRAPPQHFALIGAVQRLNQRLLEDGKDVEE